MRIAVVASLVLFFQIILAKSELRLVQEWKEVEYVFPDEGTKRTALEQKYYIPGEPFMIDVDVFYKSGGKAKVFVTTPRFGPGRPATLGVVTKEVGSNGGALIAPYPDYSWQNNQGTDCDGLTSVLRIAIDECSRLWVLDTGNNGDTQICPPQLLAFDLNTDHLILRHRFTDAVNGVSLLITPVVDVRDPGTCADTFVYIADVTGFGIIVFQMSTGTSWRATNKLMYPYPSQGTFTIAGESFDLMDGVFSLAVHPSKGPENDRTLYFHALASVTENTVMTSVLRNSTAWIQNTANPRDFKLLPGERSSQSAAEAIDRNGIMFFSLLQPRAIACWNTATKFSRQNFHIVAQDDETLQFPSGLKVVNNLKGGQELWVMTCRFQKVMTGSRSTDEVNYRILAASIPDLVKGTKCDVPNGQAAHHSNFISKPVSSTYGGAKFL